MQGEGVEIRPVRRNEAAALRELRLRALGEAPGSFFSSVDSERDLPMASWEEWTASEDRVMFVAVQNGEWIGMAGALLPADKPGTASLRWLWVAPVARGRGLARRLQQARTEWARVRGAVRLELAVAKNNEAVLELWCKLGFTPTGERRTMASDPTRTGVFLARPL